MIRLGLRLTLQGGREAATRLVITTLATALGVSMLLFCLAAMNSLHAESSRAAWLDSSTNIASPATQNASPQPIWWLVSVDQFGTDVIDRVDVGAARPTTLTIPGLAHLPGPGQYDASPAMKQLLRATPARELGDRYPGRDVGTIGPSGLASPDSLIIVVGHESSALSSNPNAQRLSWINTSTSPGGPGSSNVSLTGIILAVGACALVLPLLVLIGAATRLSATRREQRFAAMRLIGTTPRQVAIVAAVEASMGALFGAAIGFALYFATHPLLASVSLTGLTPYPGDLALRSWNIELVALGVPIAAGLTALVALRKVQISPLGVVKRVTPKRPRVLRVLPLFAGLGILLWRAESARPLVFASGNNATTVILWFVCGFVLTMIGLVMAGTWLTMVGSRLLAWRARRPSILLASRRLLDNPRVAFRAVSGLVLALFVCFVAIGVTTTIASDLGVTDGHQSATATIVDQFNGVVGNPLGSGPVAAPSAATLSIIRHDHGVKGVTLVRTDRHAHFGDSGYVACAQLRRTPALGTCPASARVVRISPNYFNQGTVFQSGSESVQSATVWPSSTLTLSQLNRLSVDAVVVSTTGGRAVIESVRSELEEAFPLEGAPMSIGAIPPNTSQALAEGERLADVIILASLAVASCSLAVGIAGGLNDRKRPFMLLRLSGVPFKVLRRVVTLEGALPLLAGTLVSIAVALSAADLSMRAITGSSVEVPGRGFFVTVGIGLVVSLGVIAVTFPLLRRITDPTTARFE